MPVKLSSTYISPYPDVGLGSPESEKKYWNPDIHAGQSFPLSMQNPMVNSIGRYAELFCGPDCLSVFRQKALDDFHSVYGLLSLRMLSAADQRHAEGQNLKVALDEITNDLKSHPSINENIIIYPEQNRVFSGSPMSVLHGIQHARDGKGATVTFPIGNIGLNVDLLAIPDVMNVIQSARPVGRSTVDVNFAYNVFNDSFSSGLVLGNITLRAVGDINKNASGSWEFLGEIRAYNDVFDANPSRHRSWAGETGTQILGAIMRDSYEISIPGSISVRLGGASLNY